MHGNIYRKNFPGIWQEVFDIINEKDANAKMMINDYQVWKSSLFYQYYGKNQISQSFNRMNFFQIISADVSQCFLDLVKEEPLDYLGLQEVQNF